MIKEEFEKEACSRGSAPNIGLVRKYTKLHKKDFYYPPERTHRRSLENITVP